MAAGHISVAEHDSTCTLWRYGPEEPWPPSLQGCQDG